MLPCYLRPSLLMQGFYRGLAFTDQQWNSWRRVLRTNACLLRQSVVAVPAGWAAWRAAPIPAERLRVAEVRYVAELV